MSQFDFIDMNTMLQVDGSYHAYYRLYAKVSKNAVINGLAGEKLRNLIINQLVTAGVPCFFGSCAEIYREKLFANIAPSKRLRNAASFSDNALCFLVHHTITCEQMAFVADNIKQVLTDLIQNRTN